MSEALILELYYTHAAPWMMAPVRFAFLRDIESNCAPDMLAPHRIELSRQPPERKLLDN